MATTKVLATRGASSAASQQYSSVLSNSPAVSEKPASNSTKKTVICPICEEEVVDSVRSRKKSHDSVFCEGICHEWIHRQCAGLSKRAFIAVGNSKNPFRCPRCVIAKQPEEIAELKASVVDLYREVAILQEKTKTLLTGAQKVEGSKTSDNLPATSPLHSTLIAQPVPSRHPSSEPDKKFNVVVFGISESPKGTSRYYRSSNDYDKASSVL